MGFVNYKRVPAEVCVLSFSKLSRIEANIENLKRNSAAHIGRAVRSDGNQEIEIRGGFGVMHQF